MSVVEYMERVVANPDITRSVTDRFAEGVNLAEMDHREQREAYGDWIDGVEAYTYEWKDLPEELNEDGKASAPMQQDPLRLLDQDGYDQLREEMDEEAYQAAVAPHESVLPAPESRFYMDRLEDTYESREELLDEHVDIVPLQDAL